MENTKKEALSILNTTKALRNYIENVQRPLLYQLKKEGRLEADFFNPKILSSSYIVAHTYALLLKKKKIDFTYNLSSPNPMNPANQASKFESDLLKTFQNGEKKIFFNTQNENGTKYLYIAMPLDRNKPSCLQCHGNPKDAPAALLKYYGNTSGFHEHEGDIRALISLKVPLSSVLSYHMPEFVVGGIAMLFAFVVFIFLAFLFYKQEAALISKKEILLQNQNKLASMGSMISNIAHQWRQPLAQIASILVNIELRSKVRELPHDFIIDKVRDANKQISFMSQTIDDFRNFYSHKHEHKPFSIAFVVEHANRLTSAAIYENDITIITEIQNNFMLYGTHNDLTQAIINIINNSKDAFTGKKIKNKYIIIKACICEGSKVLSIEDNAGGIDEKIIQKIFKPYFTTKHPNIGTGIGLHMVKLIVEEKYNGQIEVSNTKSGVLFSLIMESKAK